MSFLSANNTFEKVDTFTQSKLAPKTIDTVFGSNVLIQVLQSQIGTWAWKTMDYTVKYKKLNNWGSFSGLDRFTTNYVDTTKRMSFAPKNYEQPITIPKTDVNVGMTQEAVIPLVTFAMEEAAQEMADSLGSMLYGDWTWNGWKDLLGLKAWCWDWTVSTNYGWIARATYGLSGTLNSTTYTWGWTEFSLAILNTHLRAVESGNQRITAMFCDETVFSVIEALFATPEQNTNLFPATNSITNTAQVAALWVNQGYRSLHYKGIPIIPDEQCTAKHLFTVNMKTWTFPVMKRMIDTTPIRVASKTIEGQYSENLERPVMFHIGDWLTPDDQYAMINHIYLTWNLICKNPRFNGVFTDIAP